MQHQNPADNFSVSELLQRLQVMLGEAAKSKERSRNLHSLDLQALLQSDESGGQFN